MDTERWLAPLTGAIAMGTGLSLVAVYGYGRSLPVDHVATVEVRVPATPEEAWALLSDPARRPEWASNVSRVGRVDDVAGRETWRELDPGDDRFDFSILVAEFPTFEFVAARPEDIGMIGTWTWTVVPDGAGALVSVTEQGRIDNLLFRGVWALRTGPYASIERDAAALSVALGGDGHTTRR